MLSGSLRPVTPAPGNPGDPGGPEDPGDPLSLDISQLVLAKLDTDQCDVETEKTRNWVTSTVHSDFNV